jgi:transposase
VREKMQAQVRDSKFSWRRRWIECTAKSHVRSSPRERFSAALCSLRLGVDPLSAQDRTRYEAEAARGAARDRRGTRGRIHRRVFQPAPASEMLPLLPQYKPVVARLRCFRGIDTHSAMVLATEIGDWRRFESPRRLMAYVGLVPSEHSSGEKRRQGSITKCGNAHCRHVLLQAA